MLDSLTPISLLAQVGIHSSAWSGRGSLHPLAAAFLVGAFIVCIFGKQKFLIFFALLASVAVFSPAQRIVVASLDFSLPRVVIVFLFVRLAIRPADRLKEWNGLDACFIGLMVMHLVGNAIRSDGDVVNRLGFALDYLGSYLILRSLIREESDVRSVCLALSVIASIMLPFYLTEWFLRRNLLSFMGGVPEYVVMRSGRPRCQGPFSHPINSGLFYGLVLPVIGSFLVGKRSKSFVLTLGFVVSLLILLTSSSSTPASALLIGAAVWLLFSIRRVFPIFAWLSLPFLCWAHFFLNKGLPSVFSKLDLVAGSTGWHRFHLIDSALKYIGEWWLVGVTGGTAVWGGYLSDVTNEYLSHGFQGGILATILIASILVLGCIRVFRTSVNPSVSANRQKTAYGIFASLLAAGAAFTSVTMFSGLFVIFSFLLASGVAISAVPKARTTREKFRRAGLDKRVPLAGASMATASFSDRNFDREHSPSSKSREPSK